VPHNPSKFTLWDTESVAKGLQQSIFESTRTSLGDPGLSRGAVMTNAAFHASISGDAQLPAYLLPCYRGKTRCHPPARSGPF